MIIDDILREPSYATSDRTAFVRAMNEAFRYHRSASPQFRAFLGSQSYDPEREYTVEDMPFLPVSIFKEMELTSGDLTQIKKKVFSSATTGKKPSVICLDQITIDRQRKALTQIMADVIGPERRPFIILDAESTVKATGQDVSSRGSAIRGFLPFATTTAFVLNRDLALDEKKIPNAPDAILFGFTWVVYRVMEGLKKKNIRLPAKKLLHIGGWKKLKDIAVSKEAFNALAYEVFSIPKGGVVDIYGMTEQLGTVYPDCQESFKHVPLYADVLTRGSDLRVLPVGEAGQLQFLTPLPHSYPGLSILTDDIGEIVGVDGCACGRKGKYFVFKKRHEEAELKGCGDTL